MDRSIRFRRQTLQPQIASLLAVSCIAWLDPSKYLLTSAVHVVRFQQQNAFRSIYVGSMHRVLTRQ